MGVFINLYLRKDGHKSLNRAVQDNTPSRNRLMETTGFWRYDMAAIPEIEALQDARRYSDMFMQQALDDANEVRAQLAVNDVCQAIRKAGRIDCTMVASILHTLACQMAQSGMSASDVECIDQAADVIGG